MQPNRFLISSTGSPTAASSSPLLLITLALGLVAVVVLLVHSWSAVESPSDIVPAVSKSSANVGSSTSSIPAPRTESPVSTQSAASREMSLAAPVVEETKQPEELFEVVEPAPTPEPLIVPAIYAQPAARALLSDEQRQLLDQAASQFNATIRASGMSPYAPGYADLWKQSAQQADDIFRQQYGDDALQALKGPTPTPTPEPTPLSPQDDAYRTMYGEEALQLRVLEREGRLIRVKQ